MGNATPFEAKNKRPALLSSKFLNTCTLSELGNEKSSSLQTQIGNPMIITLKLQTPYTSPDEDKEPWFRTIEIESSATLEDLHLSIQDAIDFDNDHMYEFFIANSIRSRNKIRFDDENNDVYERSLDDLFPLPKNKKVFYLFDYGDSWYFRITKSRKKPKEKELGVSYPRVIDRAGKDLIQYPEYEY
jgi:hypothetical protein